MQPRAGTSAWVLAGLVAAPLLLLVGINTVGTIVDLGDPCTEWGATNESTLSPDGDCAVRKGHASTRVEHVAARAAIDGLLAYGAVAGLVAAWRGSPVVAALGASALLFVSIPLFVGAFGLVAVSFAVLLAVLTRRLMRLDQDDEEERPVAIAFAGVLLGLGVLTLAVVLGGPADKILAPMFAVAALIGALFVRAHWPRLGRHVAERGETDRADPADGPDDADQADGARDPDDPRPPSL